jgi:hypothetical protein
MHKLSPGPKKKHFAVLCSQINRKADWRFAAAQYHTWIKRDPEE